LFIAVFCPVFCKFSRGLSFSICIPVLVASI
jgi:hypothetical protein